MSHLVDSSKKFKLSFSLRREVISALTKRMVEGLQQDYDKARDVVENGFTGLLELDDYQLIEDYIDWHGLYDEGDIRRDSLMCRIIDEQGNDAFEREFLGGKTDSV